MYASRNSNSASATRTDSRGLSDFFLSTILILMYYYCTWHFIAQIASAWRISPASDLVPVVGCKSTTTRESVGPIYHARSACFITQPLMLDSFDTVLHALRWKLIRRFPFPPCRRRAQTKPRRWAAPSPYRQVPSPRQLRLYSMNCGIMRPRGSEYSPVTGTDQERGAL